MENSQYINSSHSHIHQLPSSSNFSNSRISREINSLKDELRSLKADIACINRRPPAVFPSELQQQFGLELKTLRDEICHLQDRLLVVQNLVQIPPLSANSSSFSKNDHDRNLNI